MRVLVINAENIERICSSLVVCALVKYTAVLLKIITKNYLIETVFKLNGFMNYKNKKSR